MYICTLYSISLTQLPPQICVHFDKWHATDLQEVFSELNGMQWFSGSKDEIFVSLIITNSHKNETINE